MRLLRLRHPDQRGRAAAAKPDPAERRGEEALDRNLCRCGSHNRMVRAVLRAADEMAAHEARRPPPAQTAGQPRGQSAPVVMAQILAATDR